MATLPQFGGPDYSGFTTDEELARRRLITSERGSPLIGAMTKDVYESDELQPSVPQLMAGPLDMRAGARVEEPPAPMGTASAPPMTVSAALKQLLQSKPTSAFDWIVIIILITVFLCFFQYGSVFLDEMFGSPHNTSRRRHHRRDDSDDDGE